MTHQGNSFVKALETGDWDAPTMWSAYIEGLSSGYPGQETSGEQQSRKKTPLLAEANGHRNVYFEHQ